MAKALAAQQKAPRRASLFASSKHLRGSLATTTRLTLSRGDAEREASRAAVLAAAARAPIRLPIGLISPSAAPAGMDSGAPLEPTTRAQLERAFDADLGAVRVHDDPGAHREAAQRKARAFAAGPHVFFAAGEYDRDTANGELLAHEVAHVLQQTGRRDGDGRMRATDLGGGEQVQRAEAIDGTLAQMGLFPAIPTFKEVAQRHREANASDVALDAEIKDAETKLGGAWTTDKTKIDLIVASADRTKANKTQRQFYIDCLKALGRDDKAVELLAMKWNVDTAFLSQNLYKEIRKRNGGDVNASLDWLVERVKRRDFTVFQYPKPFVDAFKTWLVDLFATMPPGVGKQAVVNEVLKSTPAKTTKGLFDNETGVAGVVAFALLDMARVKLDEDRPAPTAATKKGASDISEGVFGLGGRTLWYYKRDIARLAAKSSAREFFPHIVDEATVLLGAVWPEIQDTAKQATATHDRTEALVKALEDSAKFENLGDASEVIAGIAKDARFSALGKTLSAMVGRLAARPVTEELVIESYVQLISGLRTDLRSAAKPIVSELRKSYSAAIVDQLYQVRLDFVLWGLAQTDLELERYSRSADEAFAKQYKSPDVRVAHRTRVMTSLGKLGNALGFTSVGTSADAFLAVKTTYLALLGKFTLVNESFDDAWIGVREDIDLSLPIRGNEPLTVGMLLSFIYALYYETLKSALETELAQRRGKPIDPKLRPITVAAVENAESVLGPLRPRQYVMRDFEGLWAGQNTMSDLIFSHPKVKSLPKPTTPTWRIAPDQESTQRLHGIKFWEFPAIDKLQEVLANAPVLQTAAANAWTKMRERAAELHKPLPETPDYDGWLDALRIGTLGAPSTKASEAVLADPTLAAETKKTIEDKLATEHSQMVIKAREASNLERKAAHQRIQILRGWTDDNAQGDHLTKLFVPNRVAQIIYAFGGTVLPEDDRPYQVAALMLEDANLFKDEFGPQKVLLVLETESTQRTDIIAEYLPLLRGTLTIWNKYAPTLVSVIAADAAWIKQAGVNAVALQTLLDQFEATKLSQQMRFGLVGGKGAGIHPWKSSRGKKPGERWIIEGVHYELGQVFEDFEYHPKYLEKPSPIAFPKTDRAPDSLLNVNGAAVPGNKRSTRALLSIKRNGIVRTVTEQDDDLLAELTYAMTLQAVVESLDDLNTGLEWYGEALMTVIEIVQPEVAGARIVASLLQFIISPEFDALVELATTDGWGLVGKIFEQLKGMFDLERVLTWFFFGTEPTWMGKIKEEQKTPAQEKVTSNEENQPKGGVLAKLGALIKRILTFGKKIALGFDAVRKVIQAPVRRAQDFIASHPILRVLFTWVVELYDRLKDLDWQKIIDDPSAAIKDETKKALTSVVDFMRDAFAHLAELQLPEEVIPLQNLVDIGLDMGIERLPGKWKAGGKVAVGLLKLIGKWDYVTGAIAGKFKEAKLDPNILYRKLVRDQLEGPFEKIRDELVGAIADVFKDIGLGIVTEKKGSPIEFSMLGDGAVEGEEQAEANPALRGSAPATLRVPALDHVDGGVPLSAPTRSGAEAHFGHDLGHVRIHSGVRADSINDAVGSFALTKGSHILLADDVGMGTPAGDRVLGHELGHVLQQTGPRPLGGSYDPSPVGGSGAARVRYDVGHEAAADRAALGGGSIQPAAGFVQPSARGLFGMFLAKTMEDFRIQKRAASIDKEAKSPAALDTYSSQVAKQLAEKVPAQITSLVNDPKNFDAPFNDTGAPQAIIEYLKNTDRLKSLASAAVVLAGRARRKLDMGKAPPNGPAPEPAYRMTPRALELELEEYLFGASGVAFDVVVESKTETPPGAKRARSVVPTDAPGGPVKSIRVRNLYMNFIGGNADLWDRVLDGTFKGSTFAKYSDARKPEYRSAARVILRSTDRFATWHSTKFRFSDGLARDIDSRANMVKADKLDPALLPPADVYVTTDPNNAEVQKHAKSTGSHIGLRIGTYKQKDTDSSQTGSDRESHHTTQFVLLEYLYGAQSQLPVQPLASFKSLGVASSGGKIKSISSALGSTVWVEKYASGDRGEEMPTVLLAKRTHQKGNVHIPGESADETQKASQSGWVHNRFQEAIGNDAAGKIIKNEPKKLDMIAGGAVVDGVSAANVKDRIFSAACSTYIQMRALMMPRLEGALAGVETEYYNAKAQEAGRDLGPDKEKYSLDPARTMGIMGEVIKNNDAVLETGAGFKRP